MAAKANQGRTRIIRSALLSASVLSLVPLIGVMQSGAGATEDLTAMAPAADIAAESTLALATASQPAGQATVAATASASSQTTAPATTQSSYTRTKAS